jgi:hypothetical protein
MFACDQQRNLGQRARGKAVTLGVIMGGVALGWALLSSELGVARKLGWLVALPAAFSAYLLISGSLGICIYNSMKGYRGADHGNEAVLDPHNRQQLRLRALVAVSVSLLIGCGLTAALMASAS